MAQIIRALGCVVIALVATAANSEIVSVWEGTENGLPSVELSVQIKDGKVNGSTAFYFQSRGADGKWQLGDKYVVPLLSPEAGRSQLEIRERFITSVMIPPNLGRTTNIRSIALETERLVSTS